MVFLFTVASPRGSDTAWYARFFSTGTSFCFDELTTLLQPYPSNQTLDDWLASQVADHDFELAQRRRVLQGYPSYFARHWERTHWGQHVVGNSDTFVGAVAPGLWLLWPEMRFVFSFTNGVKAVDNLWKASLEADSAAFAGCCREWVSSVERVESHRDWLEARGAKCLVVRIEDVRSDMSLMETVWNWIVGDWPRHAARNATFADDAARHTAAIRQTWQGWSLGQQQVFETTCDEAQERLGYDRVSRPTLPTSSAT